MAAISWELIKDIAVRKAGRTPVPLPQSWVHFPIDLVRPIIPNKDTDGIEVTDAIVAKVGVRLNKVAGEFRGWLKVHTASAGVPYGVQYFGTGAGSQQITGASAADVQTIIDNVLADFVASFTWGSASQVDGEDLIEWLIDEASNKYRPPYDPPDWFKGPAVTLIDEIRSDGAGMATTANQSMVCEATECTWRVWGIPLGMDEFELIDGNVYTSFSPYGVVDIPCAGYTKLFVEVINADGSVLPFVGPGQRDDLADQLLASALTSWGQAENALYTFDNANFGRIVPTARPAFTVPGCRGAQIKNNGNHTVPTSGTGYRLLPPNPNRRGFFVQVLGGNDIWCNWNEGRRSTINTPVVGSHGFRIETSLVRTGDDVPGDALYALADTTATLVYAEDW
jgi:hypothetical protein